MGRKCWRWILVTNEDKKKILKVKELVEEYRTVFNTVGAENKREKWLWLEMRINAKK